MSIEHPTGSTALVTGGAGGIGSTVARTLAAGGHRVVVAYRSAADAAKELVAEIEAAGGTAVALRADVTDADQVAALFADAVRQFGQVDIVVNNAGTMIPRPLADLTDDVFDKVFAVNVRGALNVLREAARRLADGGRVINISSTQVAETIPGSGAYAASKAALEAFGRVAAKELGPRGITVNSLRVGPTVPGMFSQAPPQRQEAMAAASPFQRLGTPQDIADVISFLAGDGGRWVTGQVITVDGGAT
ncbi:3-ketoacyl-ACP reductase [Streptomyces fodineus]|uniref:3-ketoacyl-ACP reductase n=1 Tax=Streptomyces fodineus TaxID=1904616 RepID=A0A1D7YBH4_9ACTN|nr:SDR family oxidoreductase [Streptomyces fodineus]AOR32941.1 3-ketoacyl-ACP reductase [Streptomyces fodineus]